MISIIIYRKKSFAKNQASSVFIYLCYNNIYATTNSLQQKTFCSNKSTRYIVMSCWKYFL